MTDTNGTPQTEEKAEKRRAARQNRDKRGLVLVNTGDGKGKTTAALGVVLRMLGRGKRVCVIQFLKHEGGNWGEVRAAKAFDGLDWIKTGDGFTWTSKDIDETQARALHGWQIAQEKIASGDYDLVLLDEFTYPMHFGWVDTAEVIDWLRANKPEQMHLIVTGRSAPDLLVEYADTVTEMTKVKHAFDAGISAVAGIEF
jgi:cob(I)alamin adenosyltransferase